MSDFVSSILEFDTWIWALGPESIVYVVFVIAIMAVYLLSLAVSLVRYGPEYFLLSTFGWLDRILKVPFVLAGVAQGLMLCGFAILLPMIAPINALRGEPMNFPLAFDFPSDLRHLQFYGFFCVAMSGYAIVIFARDKWIASVNGRIEDGCYRSRVKPSQLWRVPERLLHVLELSGGWPGSFVAQRLFRHKVSKGEYQDEFKACAMCHTLLVVSLVCQVYGWSLLAYLFIIPVAIKYYGYIGERVAFEQDDDGDATEDDTYSARCH